MKQLSLGETTSIAAETWAWYTLKGYSCALVFMQSLGKLEIIIGHDESINIPVCPLLEKYHYEISDHIVIRDRRIYIIQLFL